MSSTSKLDREQHDTAAAFKAARASVLLNAVLMTVQIVIGWMAFSDGLLADGIHTLADLGADGMVLIVLRLSTAAAHRRTGFEFDRSERYETAGSLLISILLIATGMETLWTSLSHMSDAGVAPSVHAPALVVAVFVIVAKEALFRYIMSVARRTRSTILVASAWHARSDAISACVAVLGIVGSMAGVPMSDSLAAALIGLMIARMGWTLAWKTFKESFARTAAGTTGR
ncbi:cation diffusion facilitator family transporter [Caballeronia sordidicola]|uniref:Cation diffusion facilitator family transporter n=1 Tax=Caballeronia sordidicola TaxID=196367 RepID=A0A158G6X7_CABSO|nr:cation diffusion facilitator family transporter [Caballeronia sordidicola]SAL27864.1 cation diffusion facilitator family transporter [Caballeronia sordidicola]